MTRDYGTFAHRVLGVNADAYAKRIDEEAAKQMNHDMAMGILQEKNIRIWRLVKLFWGRQEMADFFVKWLLTDTVKADGSPRAGFPLEVKSALLYLSNLHTRLFKFEGKQNWNQHPDTW